MQLNNKTALVMGGGQTPGATIGNGRAVSLAFANAGASVVVADRNLQSAEDTVTAITDAGGKAIAIQVARTRCNFPAGDEPIAIDIASQRGHRRTGIEVGTVVVAVSRKGHPAWRGYPAE